MAQRKLPEGRGPRMARVSSQRGGDAVIAHRVRSYQAGNQASSRREIFVFQAHVVLG